MSDRLVTPEGVELDLETATIATRGLGAMLDYALQALTLIVLTIAVNALPVDVGGGSAVAGVVVTLVALLLIRVGYPVLMESIVGATLGQMAAGIRVVTLDGGRIRARQALARTAVGLLELDGTLGLLALLVAGSRKDGRRLGDLAAGTVAVSVRTGTGPARVLQVATPPQLSGWAATLDTAALGRDELVVLRRYHERAAALPPDRRDLLAAPLAERLLARLVAQAPAGAGADAVLRAISGTVAEVAARQRGELPPEQWAPPAPPTGGPASTGRDPEVPDAPPPAPEAGGFSPPG